MNFLKKIKDKAQDKTVKEVAKYQTRKVVNDKLGLNGEYDENINALTEKAVDKVGTKNILKAKKIYDTLKEK